MERVAVARQADRQQRVERPENRDEVAWTEILVDEAVQGVAHLLGAGRADVVVVEVDGEEACVSRRQP